MAIVGGNMGLSTLGGSSIVFKRKYRWTEQTANSKRIC